METRVCNECHKEKPVDEFVKGKRYKGGYMPLCKVCRALYWKHRRANNEDARLRHNATVKRNYRKQKYGLGDAAYAALLNRQGNRCALCRSDEHGREPSKYKTWDIDHDHKTGHIRGVLCHSCNTAMGHYEKMRDLVGDDGLREYLARQIPLDELPIDPPWHGMIGRSRSPEARRSQGAKVAKLTDDQIIALLKDPRPYEEIAADYGVHRNYVSDLKNGRRRLFVAISPDEIVRPPRGRKAGYNRLPQAELEI